MAFFKDKHSAEALRQYQVSWKVPEDHSTIDNILRKIETITRDPYVRYRARNLIGNLDDIDKGVAFALTLTSVINWEEIQHLVKELETAWPVLKRFMKAGLPGQVLWEPFLRIYTEIVNNSTFLEIMAKRQNVEKIDITTLMVNFASDPIVEEAWRKHETDSYLYIPFYPARHAYDFLTVAWPCAFNVREILNCNYDTNLRALRAVGLLVEMKQFNDFCEEFQSGVIDSIAKVFSDMYNKKNIKFKLWSHVGYENVSLTFLDVNRLLQSASVVQLSVRDSQLSLRDKHLKSPSALVDVARLLGVVGRDRAYFKFDSICGLSVHPSTRGNNKEMTEISRWYGITWPFLRRLHDLSTDPRFLLPDVTDKDALVWIDSKEDARHEINGEAWAKLAVETTKNAVNFWDIHDEEERESLLDNSRRATVEFLTKTSPASNSLNVRLVEYEPEVKIKNDFLLVSIPVPHSTDYLQALMKTLGTQYLTSHPGFMTLEAAQGPLSCLSTLPREFYKGLLTLLTYMTNLTDISIDHTTYESEDLLYELYQKYYENEKEELFLAAMKSSAFLYLQDHQFLVLSDIIDESKNCIAFEKIVEKTLAIVREWNTDLITSPADVLHRVLRKQKTELSNSIGRSKLQLLNEIKALTDIALPRVYKFQKIDFFDILLCVIKCLKSPDVSFQ